MALPSYVVEARANLLARVKLIFDLLLAVAFYFGGAPWPFIAVPIADAALLLPYLRYVKRRPALLTISTLIISAGLLALAPFALGAAGVALWVLYPLAAAAAGFVLGRRKALWQMASIVTLLAAASGYFAIRAGQVLTLDVVALAALAGATAASTWLIAWIVARTLQAETGRQEILGAPLMIVKGVMVTPFNWVVGGVQSEELRLELQELKRQHNPRWLVLDLGPAGEFGRRDLNAVERAAEAVSAAACTIVLARPPADALGHLDFAQPVIGRIERFATVPQAVEAGLRRLGWSLNPEQAQRLVTAN